MHILCTICSDLLNQAENIFVTKCGHIFHHHCLHQWIVRSKSCPQCRHKVTERCMFRLYPTVSHETTGEDVATLQLKLDDTQLQLRQHKGWIKEKDEKLHSINIDLKRNEELLKAYEKKLVCRDSDVSALTEQLDYLRVQAAEVANLKEQNESLRKNLQTLNSLQKVLNDTGDEVEDMLRGYTDVKTFALFSIALKRALCESEAKKNEVRDRLHIVKQQLGDERKIVADLRAKLSHLEDRLSFTEGMYESLVNKRKAPDKDMSAREDTPPKQARTGPRVELNVAMLGDHNTSLRTMVTKIESADSPYLNLRQSSLALSALNVPNNSPEDKAKLQRYNDFGIIKAARSHSLKIASDNAPLSIFRKKKLMKHDPNENLNDARLDVSYDGLGGHSKPDSFPEPKQRLAPKNWPKLTAKHKLKRPSAPSGSQDISKMLEKMSQ